MRARVGIVLGLATLGGGGCKPSEEPGASGSEATASSPAASVAPEIPTTQTEGKYAAQLAEVAQLARLVDTFCACQDRSCRHEARTQIQAISAALPKKLPNPPPRAVMTARQRAIEPLDECERRLFPPPGKSLPAPARRLTRSNACHLQQTRDAVYFVTNEGALRRAIYNGHVTQLLPKGVIQHGWVVGKNFVYYGVQDKIRRVSIGGGRPQQVHQARWPETLITQFAVDRTHVYWEEGVLQRKAKGGGAVAEISNVHGPLTHLTVADGYVYYSNGATIGKAPVHGGKPTTLLANPAERDEEDPKQDRPRLDLPFVERGAFLYGRTEQCGVFRVPKAGGAAGILTKGPSPRDRYFGCQKGDHLAVGRSVLFEVATPEDEVLLQVPLGGGEPKEILSAGHTTICAIDASGSRPVIGTEHGIYKIGW